MTGRNSERCIIGLTSTTPHTCRGSEVYGNFRGLGFPTELLLETHGLRVFPVLQRSVTHLVPNHLHHELETTLADDGDNFCAVRA